MREDAVACDLLQGVLSSTVTSDALVAVFENLAAADRPLYLRTLLCIRWTMVRRSTGLPVLVDDVLAAIEGLEADGLGVTGQVHPGSAVRRRR